MPQENKVNLFINRPKLAIVISLVITLAGLLTIKPEKDITRQENYVTVSYKHRRKNLHKILANQTQQCI